MGTRVRAVLLGSWLLLPATAGAVDGGVARAPLDGELGPREAVVRVTRARLELGGRPRVEAGVTLGLATFDELRGEIEITNGLDRPVREVAIALEIRRDAPGSAATGKPGSEDEETAAAAAEAKTVEVAGWSFKVPVAALAAGATRTVPCRFTLPSLAASEQPSSPGELGYAISVVGYEVDGLRLEPALSLLARGAPSDQRAVFLAYGRGLDAAARLADETALIAALTAGLGNATVKAPEVARPAPAEAKPAPTDARPVPAANKPVAAGAAPPRIEPALLRFSFQLTALGRIGGPRALETLLSRQDAIAERAPPRAERADDGNAPPPNSDLVPESFAALAHETLVKVAHLNLSSLRRLVVKPSEPPNPAESAAWQFAADEELVETDDWLEASSETVTRAPAGEREIAAADQVQLVRDLLTPPPDDLAPFAAALRGKDDTLRASVAAGLVMLGATSVPCAALLVKALDEEEDARSGPIVAAAAAGAAPLRRALAAELGKLDPKITPAATSGALATQVVAASRARRAGDLAAALDDAESLAARDPLDSAIAARLSAARQRSPRAYEAARARLARLAAKIYRARAAAGRADARAVLDETAALGAIEEPEFAAALRDARIAAARALAASDLDGAIALLCDGAALPRSVVERDAAVSLILERLDAAIDAGESRRADVLMGRARRFGADAATLGPRERRLRMTHLVPRLVAASVGIAIVGVALLGVRWRRRRRRVAAR